jgi:hypothetical protein
VVLSDKAIVKKIIVTGVVSLCLFAPAMTQAGSSPVVTVGDSSSGGAINFEPAGGSAGTGADNVANEIASGGSHSVMLSSGVAVDVTSLEAAVNSTALGQDQITNGLGVAGLAVTLSPQMVVSVNTAAMTPSVLVDGELMTPLAVLQSLETALNLSGLIVAMPNGRVAVSSTVLNVALALARENPTFTGTALNDAAMVLTQMIKDGADMADIQNVAEAVAALLDAIRNPSS